MTKTKYRCIYYRDNRDGSRSYYLHITVNGTRTWRKAGETVTEARERYREYETLKGLAGFGIRIPRRIRFEELAEAYLQQYFSRTGEDPRTAYRIRSTMKRLLDAFGGRIVSEITAYEIDAAAIPRPDIDYLKAILRQARAWGYLHTIPRFYMPAAKRGGHRRCMEPDEIQAILTQASPEHADAIRLCLLAGGLRIGELTRITQACTDFERAYFWIDKRKGGQPKVFALLPEAAAILRRRFVEHSGRAFPETASIYIQRFCYERRRHIAGVKRWDFHTLRHTAATWLQRAGIPLPLISSVLGHESVSTTEVYLHTTLEQERAAIEAAILPKLFLESAPPGHTRETHRHG